LNLIESINNKNNNNIEYKLLEPYIARSKDYMLARIKYLSSQQRIFSYTSSWKPCKDGLKRKDSLHLVMSQQRKKNPTSKITLTLYDLPYFSLRYYNEKLGKTKSKRSSKNI
jgi:hypothetical protein